MKKAQGISINTIIIAAIALIVLVVLIAVFTGRISLWGTGLDQAQTGKTCNEQGGAWRVECGPLEKSVYGVFTDAKDHQGQQCCIVSQ